MSGTRESEEKELQGHVGKELLKQRTITLLGEIDWESARKFSEKLLVLAGQSATRPVKVFINSPGGYVDAGDTMFDLIRSVKPRVLVVGMGCVASAAALIYSAPPRQDRFSLPNTRFMLHQPLGGFRGSVSDVKIEAREIVKMRERLNRILAEQTGQPLDRVSRDSDRNFWMNAQEAIDYGLAGTVVESLADMK